MQQRLKQFIVSLSIVVLGVGAMTPALASAAASTTFKNNACGGLSEVGGSCSGGGKEISSVIKTILVVLSSIIGAVAVIMVMLSGFRYITSGGDSQKVATAKSTLIYAIVGLVIVALSQLIVHFVLQKTP